jgi:hypothetical protein
MEKPKLYFGHPVNVYGTKAEQGLLEIVAREFPNHNILNPNQPCHQEGYKKYRELSIPQDVLEKSNLTDKRGMNYYFLEVLPGVQDGAFLSFEDGMFGAGVYGESEFIKEANGGQIYEIGIDCVGTGIYVARMKLDERRMLSVDETRERVYGDHKDDFAKKLDAALSSGITVNWINAQ